MNKDNKYLKPETVEEALKLADTHKGESRFMAGGTDVLVNKFQGNETASCLIDIGNIAELKKLEYHEEYLRIGPLVKLDELKNYDELSSYPALLEAAHAVASPLIRKTATIGGNLFVENRCIFYNQSEWWRESVGYCLKCDGDICIATGGTKNCYSRFVSDTVPVLIALHAKIEIALQDGEHILPLEQLYTGDGLQPHKYTNGFLLKAILLPKYGEYGCIFNKLRPRDSVDYTSLTTAVSVDESGNIRIVLGGLDPQPILIEGNAKDDLEELIKKCMKKPRIVDNDVYSRTYRKEMIGVFLERSFRELGLLMREEV